MLLLICSIIYHFNSIEISRGVRLAGGRQDWLNFLHYAMFDQFDLLLHKSHLN